MNQEIEKLKAELEKAKYHIRLLGEAADLEKCPIASFVVEADWSEENLEQAREIFERYDEMLDKGEEPSATQLEVDFSDKFGIGHKTVELLVLAFYYDDFCVPVCKWYAKTCAPGTPMELKPILNDDGA